MILFPFAKINIGLNVVRKCPDGYHDIESVMVPIPLRDALEVIVDDALPTNALMYERTGIPVPGDPDKDLVLRAIRALQQRGDLPGLRVHLHKVIPMGAGLGGGSSDGSHALMLVDRLLDLRVPAAELHTMASALGSDCAFFLHEGPQLALGRGEVLRPVRLDLTGKHLVLINPGIHVPTAEAYRDLAPTGRTMDMAGKLESPMEEWHEHFPNTMEDAVFRKHPAIGDIKTKLLAEGARYAAMSGSGSSVYGIFTDTPPIMEWPDGYRSWQLTWP
jgi:4-diphosphocytidyl-2-C-methyl-D-erythritol kinase